MPPQEMLIKWAVLINSIENKNKQMDSTTIELYNLFTENNINTYLIKGQGVAACYPKPNLRINGDIDWYFPCKYQFDMAYKLIQSKGISIRKQAKYSKYYSWKESVIEHHRRLLDIDNPFCNSYIKKMICNEEKNAIYLNLNNISIKTPSPILTHVLVNAHILKHLLTSGIGIRQLCDSARVCYAFRDNITTETLQSIYRKTGIFHFVQIVNTLLISYIGMSEEYLPFPLEPKRHEAEKMIADIMTSGNFGQYGGPLATSSETSKIKQKKFRHWLERCIRYFRYVRFAPSEASWNPIIVVYSHIRNMFIR
jgi:hypothetical protein